MNQKSCSECGTTHHADAHSDPDVALTLADEAAQRGHSAVARHWIAVARKTVRDLRRGAR